MHDSRYGAGIAHGWYECLRQKPPAAYTADKTYSFVATEERIIAPDYAEGTDLSAAGTANSYIAPRMQEIYLFDATVQGNGRATTGITPQKLKGTSARLIWQTGTAERAVVCDVGYNGSRISFRTGTAIGGNALSGCSTRTATASGRGISGRRTAL